MTVILFGNQFTFDSEAVANEATELAKDCFTVSEFIALLYAEEVNFIRKSCVYVSNYEPSSRYQLSLL